MNKPVIFIPGSIFFLWMLFFLFSRVLLIAQVQESSMHPLLTHGQYILIQRNWYSPDRGDVVVFPSPEEGHLMIKRCLLVPGDSIVIENHWLKTNQGDYYLSRSQERWLQDYSTVPQNRILVLGDNQFHSVDSRDFGFISYDQLLGRLMIPHE